MARNPQWNEIEAEYPGRCKHPECKNDIRVGDKVLWASGYGAMCIKHISKTSHVLTKVALPTAGGQLPVRVAYGWKEVERSSEPSKTTAEWREEPIPTRVKK